MTGPPIKYKKEYDEQARKLCLLGYIDRELADFFNVTEPTINNWKKNYPSFKAALIAGKEVADAEVAQSLYKRANGFRYKEITEELVGDNTQKARHGGKAELTEAQWEICKSYFGNKCAYCGSKIDKLTKEHIIPFNSGGEFTMSNIIPACQRCNSSKKDRVMEEWYQDKEFFSDESLSKIYNYIEFALNIENQNNTKLSVTKVIEKEVAPDTGAAMAWLKNRQPKKWRDRQNIELEGSMNINQRIANMTDEEKIRRREELKAKIGD